MSVNFNRKCLNSFNDRKSYNIKYKKILFPIYYEEGWNEYPKYRIGYDQNIMRKTLRKFKIRRYRTWKYNRNNQYK